MHIEMSKKNKSISIFPQNNNFAETEKNINIDMENIR